MVSARGESQSEPVKSRRSPASQYEECHPKSVFSFK